MSEQGARPPEETEWLRRYEERSRDFAACRFLVHMGQPPVDDPDLARWVALHDERSGALSGKPLA